MQIELFEAISKILNQLHKDSGVSQNKIGQLVGVSHFNIYHYEQVQATSFSKIFRQYADHFDVSLDYLLGRTYDHHGTSYGYKPKYESINPEMKKIVEMCFEPKS